MGPRHLGCRALPVLLVALTACGASDGDGNVTPDAAIAPGYFIADDVQYPLISSEAYVNTPPSGTQQFVIRGSGAATRCDPEELINCYELIATTPLNTSGSVSCGNGVLLTLLIDGGASTTYFAGGALGGTCEMSITPASAVGEPAGLAIFSAMLVEVGNVEEFVTVTDGGLSAIRDADRP